MLNARLGFISSRQKKKRGDMFEEEKYIELIAKDGIEISALFKFRESREMEGENYGV